MNTAQTCLQQLSLIAERFTRWARTPRYEDGGNLERRHRAWCLYVDARDGLPDGTTEAREALESAADERQMGLFERRLV